MSDRRKSHSFHSNPRPINMFFWHFDYIKMQQFAFFFRSKAISFFFVWRSVNSSQAIIIIIFARNGYFCTNQNTVCVLRCWVWQANRQEIRLIHTIVLLDARVTSTWTFHSVTTAAAAMAAVALIVLDACGLSFLVYKSMYVMHTLWCGKRMHMVPSFLACSLFICVYILLNYKSSFHFNLHFRQTHTLT